MGLNTTGINSLSFPAAYYKNNVIYENLLTEASNLANYLIHRISLFKNGLPREKTEGGFAVTFNQMINDLAAVTETPPNEKSIKAIAASLNKTSNEGKTISPDKLIDIYTLQGQP